MATLDMQNTAQLAESRRKMQARRRMKNRIALTLSMATMAFGLFSEHGGRRAGERPGREWIIDSLGYRIGYAAGDYGRDLSGGIWP